MGAKCRRIVRKEQGRPPSELPPPNKERMKEWKIVLSFPFLFLPGFSLPDSRGVTKRRRDTTKKGKEAKDEEGVSSNLETPTRTKHPLSLFKKVFCTFASLCGRHLFIHLLCKQGRLTDVHN